MSELGLRMMEWLRSHPDVTMVRDDTGRCGDAIRCHAYGANWVITLGRSNAGTEPQDPREPQKTDEYD